MTATIPNPAPGLIIASDGAWDALPPEAVWRSFTDSAKAAAGETEDEKVAAGLQVSRWGSANVSSGRQSLRRWCPLAHSVRRLSTCPRPASPSLVSSDRVLITTPSNSHMTRLLRRILTIRAHASPSAAS